MQYVNAFDRDWWKSSFIHVILSLYVMCKVDLLPVAFAKVLGVLLISADFDTFE